MTSRLWTYAIRIFLPNGSQGGLRIAELQDDKLTTARP
jgi:hypothetical protein